MQQSKELRERALLYRLHKLNEIGISLSKPQHPVDLLEEILLGAKKLTCADGGTLYSIKEGRLQFEIVRTDSLKIHWGGKSGASMSFPDIPLLASDGQPNMATTVSFAANSKKTLNIPDFYKEERFDFSGSKEFEKQTGYRTVSFLTVPMIDQSGEVIGVLQLINALDDNQRPRAFTVEDQHLVESLASQAAVAMSNTQLIVQLNGMLEGFIGAIADAIDEQSSHTSGHCRRVPILARLLAEAVNKTDDGPLAAMHFSSEDLYELNIAALLHDCGKVTTPVHIIDKKRRLETVWDRFALIETRIEILKKDLEIGFLKNEIGLEERQARTVLLDQALETIYQANLPVTVMSAERQAEIRAMAQISWNDAKGQKHCLLSDDEVNNLCVETGTLNPQEKEIVRHHVVSTIKILRNLPYPSHLKNVPEIAGTHHERINGSGYPYGLKGEQMSLQAKVLAIADIFEALTAPDRPYKPPMPLSRAIEILRQESEKGHIDASLVDIFIRQEVGLEYTKRYLHHS